MLRLDFSSFKFPPSPKVISVLKENADSVNEYPDPSYKSLKSRIGKKYRIGCENILLGNGLDEVIDLITRSLCSSADEVIIPVPTFSQYEAAAKRVGAKVKKIGCLQKGKFEVSPAKLIREVTDKTRLMWICTPNNPTGDAVDKGTIRKLKAAGVPIIIDNALGDFCDTDYGDLVKERNFLLLRTFSKGYCLAGLRIGYAVGDSDLIRMVELNRQIFNVDSLALLAACAALDDQIYYDRLWKAFAVEKRRYIRCIQDLGIRIIGAESNFLLLDLVDGSIARSVYNELCKREISVLPGWSDEFSGLGERYLRVVIGDRNQNEVFIDALRDIMQKLFKNRAYT